MSQTPSGWYDDPTPEHGQAGLRWWDGQGWTAHTAPRPADHAAHTPTYVAQGVSTTPDGQPLAGWGRRFGGYVIDGVITSLVTALVGFPLIGEIVRRYVDEIEKIVNAGQRAGNAQMFELYGQVAGPIFLLSLIAWVVGAIYTIGLLRWRGATVGHSVLGMQVRLRERPGRLSWGTAAIRWAAMYGVGILGAVPVLGTIASLYPLLDNLWPLWDQQRQALHDKAAKTNVVRI